MKLSAAHLSRIVKLHLSGFAAWIYVAGKASYRSPERVRPLSIIICVYSVYHAVPRLARARITRRVIQMPLNNIERRTYMHGGTTRSAGTNATFKVISRSRP